ncbi:bifunctional oligoribonuclease/PAP phosphatase NrnA [Pseudodesulfovibrio sp.]|uniref:DHH family phosphoesterase n=1 Tax=Pseudodesulfovibrio sp. TaxID=2035812 RepID=UPI002601DE42|nr:bifunctional oligoribonuclease/PAP phosphatase NrnA [Pseudodesulfovibrio sp.]MDD3312336.1 bifunctional oligoribonuclease/PAP phosphatase NrnA [Pseudodesulfovibrio sp.]
MATPLKRISDILRDGDDFMVASHYNPDGDAIGAMCGVGHLLRSLGKHFRLYNPSGLPARYDFTPLPAPVLTELPDTLPRWTIVLDCGSAERMGEPLVARAGETRIINIDHHLGNSEFGEENWVDMHQPAVGCMVALLAEALGIPLTGELAECVYLAVATDTGFFSYGSTTPESLELAARLLRDGLNIADMNRRITKQWSEERMHLWTEVMGTVELHLDRQVAIGIITREMFERTGTGSDDTENIINFIRRLKSVRMAAILREEGPDTFKFSLRSYGEDNVQAVAARFGGGGHKNASGGTIRAPLKAAKTMLVEVAGDVLGIR